MEILSYIAFVIAGLLIALLGGGGSILIVPLLVYVFRLDIVTATAYSLLLLAISSSFASFDYFKRKLLDYKVFLLFGIPSIVSVYFTRTYFLRIVPAKVEWLNGQTIERSSLIMVLFAALMIVAGVSLIRKRKEKVQDEEHCAHCSLFNKFLLVLQGALVGFLTALVGAGGGFLIVPMLILFAKMPVKKAIGTSLLLIFTQSLVGFLSNVNGLEMDWQFLAGIVVLVLLGIAMGIRLSKRIEGAKLRPLFGYFVLLFSVVVLYKELYG